MSEPEVDFYRTRLREIGVKLDRAATNLDVAAEDRQALLCVCRVIVDECLRRPRSNGPAFDELEKLRGDLHSREVDLQVMAMETRELKIFRDLHRDFQEAVQDRGWAWRLWRIGCWIDRVVLRRQR